MNNKTNIFLVYPHPESISGNQRVAAALLPFFLVLVFVFQGKPSVIKIYIFYSFLFQKRGKFFRFFPRSYINNPRSRIIFHKIQNPLVFIRNFFMEYPQIISFITFLKNLRRFQCQFCFYISDYFRSCCSRKG